MSKAGIPVLNYHAIDGNMAANPDSRNVSVSLQSFKNHMEWLHKHGYKSISEADLRNLVLHRKPVSGKHMLITFDDGYYSLYQHAQPIMAQYGFTATLFLSTAYIGKPYGLSDFYFVGDDRQLSWEEIRSLSANGWSIQSHGDNHVKMNGLDKQTLIKEITDSKKAIEENLGKPVDSFAFPYGLYNKMVLDQLKATGYTMAYSVHSGLLSRSSQRMRIPRIEINNMDTMESFMTKVTTGYISPENERRSKIRDIIYGNPAVKDLIEKVTPKFGFGNH
ncbi:MAG: polysaccharide deacetylase [Flavipsychrobacter sp.]|nr:polysaccharide deacetylase [Flavipsychrobacter sp.]